MSDATVPSYRCCRKPLGVDVGVDAAVVRGLVIVAVVFLLVLVVWMFASRKHLNCCFLFVPLGRSLEELCPREASTVTVAYNKQSPTSSHLPPALDNENLLL
ncbi:hypothetical protein L6452_13245 [Arctium lappa]|uniref:Uncharacterized protein n=1 Tax=Arctium lappa TaxID=4217 RepID=A0ACB9CHP1_ARCLA|nr:hypothetical protein L6452_13245 [Arctium lappa]